MDSKHNNNRKRQPLEDEQLPPELQWENMEAGILRKMEELKPVTASAAKKRRRTGLVIFLLLLVALIPALLLMKEKPTLESEELVSEQTATPSEAVNDSEADEVRNTVHSGAEDGDQRSASELAKEERVGDAQNVGQQSGAAFGLNQQLSEVKTATERLEIFRDQPAQVLSPSREVSILDDGSTPATSSLITVSTAEDEDLPSSEQMGEEADLTSQPDISFSVVVEQLLAGALNQEVVSQTRQEAVNLPVPIACWPGTTSNARAAQFWLTGGTSWWNPGYGELKPERAEYEKTVLSYQGQFTYVKPFKKSLMLMVGIQYQQLENRLNWNTIIDNYDIVLEDTIIQIQRNAVTGEETEIRGDVTLTVPAERRVQHFNSFTLVQVPLAIGKTWGERKWQSHLFVGGMANLSFSRAGRTLYENSLVDYEDNSPEIWSNQLGFSAMLSGGLSYRITDRLGLTTVLQYQHSLSNWSAEQDIIMRPRILNWSIGASYSW